MPDAGPSPLEQGLPSPPGPRGALVLPGPPSAAGLPGAAGAASAPDPPTRAPASSAPGAPALPGPPSVASALGAPAAAPDAGPAPAAPPAPQGPSLERILAGPTGLGTAGLLPGRREPDGPALADVALSAAAEPEAGAGTPAEGTPIPGLYHHPVPEPDPARVAEVSRRIKAWAVDEVQAFPPEWEDQFDGFSVGRYMVACHPDAPTVEHVMVATRLMVAENAVDDCYCEDHGGSPVGLGSRLLLAHTALDALHTTEEYQPAWAASLLSDGPRRAYRSAMEYFLRRASHSQGDRYRHDMARLHLGYLAEAAWSETGHMPEVWEYLAMRQFNNFRPCPTITDTVGGYELPADLHAQAAVQRVIALAGNATTIVNDLYSYTKELDSPGRHLNLPVVIADREGLSERDAYLKAVDVHNELMHTFESEAADLAAAFPVPVMARFLRGVATWVDGNHYWHRTNTYRYSLPDFW